MEMGEEEKRRTCCKNRENDFFFFALCLSGGGGEWCECLGGGGKSGSKEKGFLVLFLLLSLGSFSFDVLEELKWKCLLGFYDWFSFPYS